MVWRLDRLGRSIKDLIAWMSWFEQEGVALRSLQEAIDTISTSGKLTFHIFASLAEFERQLIQERTRAGLKAARARGRLGGRPKALKPGRQKRAVQLYHKKELTVRVSSHFHDPGDNGICRADHGLRRKWHGPGPQ